MLNEYIKTNIKKILLGIFGVSIVGIAFLLAFFGEKMEDHMVAKLSDTLSESVRIEMARQIEQTTSLAIAVASNELLATAMKNKDRSKAGYIIDTVMSQFDGYGGANKFWVQLHTPDLRVFLRSWDKSDYGASLEGFRKGLVYVRSTERPFTSIELGKKLNIKAIVPVKLNNKYVGSLEIIKNFDESIESFKERKISLFVLMDKRYLDIAEWMRDYPILGDFVLCHRVYDEKLFEELKNENLYSIIGQKRSFTKSYFLSYEPLRDISGERIGFFVAAIPKASAMAMLKSKEDMSFLASNIKENLGRDFRVKAVVDGHKDHDLKKISEMEEKREKLLPMSKEELENIIIYGGNVEINQGEVR